MAGLELQADDEYVQTQMVMLAASHHDLESLRTLLRNTPANIKDPDTGFSPLHAAIAGAESEKDTNQNGHNVPTDDDRAAEKTLSLLLQNGAVWNELDINGETPGCMARRLGFTKLYEIMVDAGVRAELLLNRLDGFQPLQDEDEDEDEVQSEGQVDLGTDPEDQDPEPVPETEVTPYSVTSNRDYLASVLRFQDDKILDVEANGVMMKWETNIMERTAAALLPQENLSVLNIGHGMGIVDDFFQKQSPSEHHIVEAHPAVLEKIRESGWTQRPNVTVHSGTWQEILPGLVEQNITFDAIFFDTFAESYTSFRYFFSELVIGLLKPEGRFSFFHGLGADRQISYDVYTKVVEMDLFEAGFDTEWEILDVRSLEDPSTWDDVRRKYWAVDKYRLPKCMFFG